MQVNKIVKDMFIIFQEKTWKGLDLQNLSYLMMSFNQIFLKII